MGWLWTELDKKNSPEPPKEQRDESIQTESMPAPPSTDIANTDIANTPKRLNRDEQAEVELQALLKELNDATQEPSTPSDQQYEPPTSLINHSSISPDILYPTNMSCRAAFDSAFYCQSLGGQFTNLYRYGGIRDCSDQWHNFWFCMRTNRGMMSEEERKRRIQAHYSGRAAKYRTGPSSEDVWSVREERLEGAFEGDLEALEEEMGKEKEMK